MSETVDSFPVTKRNKVVRRPQRGKYDKATVYDILDAAMLCHIAYVIDGQPYCTPTAFWREGDDLIWHGSSASRMLRAQSKGIPVCVTVTHMDAIVLARCGFNHSINYRSVMAYGTAQLVEDEAEKNRLIDTFLDRFFPGRSKLMRETTKQEAKATSFVRMTMEQASGKIRDVHVHDDEEDYAHPAWTALIPVRQVIGEIEECPRQLPGVTKPAEMAPWQAGRRLDEICAETGRLYEEAEG
ncbi:pyridoxamine 5'-phosphate oxidase family protein [Acetobacteraceae bacterium H6797]|nr:pyridoxamine 5'-phosphate oxidase family protein [Acetobacteraceae bacterium H6797]